MYVSWPSEMENEKKRQKTKQNKRDMDDDERFEWDGICINLVLSETDESPPKNEREAVWGTIILNQGREVKITTKWKILIEKMVHHKKKTSVLLKLVTVLDKEG